VLGLWLLIDRTRQRTLRWGRALWDALPLGVITVAGMCMAFPILFSQYPTTFPLEAFEASLGVGLLIGALALFVAIACGVALILALEPDAPAVFRAANRKLFGIDAIFATALAAVLAAALGRLRWLAVDHFHAQALLSADVRTAFATLSPAASGIASACQETLFWLALLVLIAYGLRYLRRWPGAAVLAGIVAAAGLVPSTIHTTGEFLLYYTIRLVYLAAAVLFLKYFAGRNYLSYLLIAWVLALLDRGTDLLSQPAAHLRLQGWIVIALLLATIAWFLAPVFRRSSRPA